MMFKTAKYLLYVILPLLTGSISYGQDMKFSGFVADSISHSPVVGAVVIISGLKDTLYTTTNDEGGFVFLNAPEDSVTFEISHISYSTFRIRTILASGQPELFFIERSSTALNSAVVTGSIPLFNFKGDTLIYNVAATQEVFDGEMLGDVLGKLPAVENDGLLKIMGKTVERAYINDRLIFGENISDAMKYLAGKEVISIKVYDETPMSERHRKYKSGKKERVINVKTRNRIDFVSAGHAIASYGRNFASAGDESDNRYTGGGAFNLFSEKWQIKTDAAADNTGRMNDPGKILVTDTEDPSYRRNVNAGLAATRTFNIPKLYSISFDYRYENTARKDSSFSETVYSPSETFRERTYSNERCSLLHTGRHTGNLKISSYDFISANLSFSAENERCENHFRTVSATDGTNEKISQNVNQERRLYEFSGVINGIFGTGLLVTDPKLDFSFANSRGSTIQADTVASGIDRYISGPVGRSQRISAQLPVRYNFKNGTTLGLSYKLQADRQKRKELRYLNVIDAANLDNLTSNDYTYDYTSHSASLDLKSGGLQINLPVTYYSQNQDRSLPAAENIAHSYICFNPYISYTWSNFPKGRSVSISAMRTSVLPSLEQSNPHIDATNPLFITQGNPDLKESSTYTLNVNGNMLIGAKHSLSFRLYASAIADDIVQDRRFFVSDTEINGYEAIAGSTYSTYTNVSGFWTANADIRYSTYIRKIKTKADLQFSHRYDRTATLIEGSEIFSDRQMPKLVLNLTNTISRNHKIALQSVTSYTYNHSREYGTTDYFDQLVSLASENRFAERFFVNAIWMYRTRIPVTNSRKISSNVLNAVAGVNLIKGNRLSASISCYDILNRTRSYTSTAVQNYVMTSFSPFL